MAYFGSVNIFYKEDGEPLDELPDGPAFDRLVEGRAVEDHLVDYFEAQYPNQINYDGMQYEVAVGGDTIYDLEWTGFAAANQPPPVIQIPSFEVEIENHTYEVSFGELRFNQAGGKRRSSRRRTLRSRRRRSSRDTTRGAQKAGALRARRRTTRRRRRATRRRGSRRLRR